MRAATAFRWSGAHWFLPALFALSSLAAAGDLARSGYATADLASASYALYFAGPVAAAFLAARFRGFTRFFRPLRSRRSGLVCIFAAWWTLLLAAPLVVCLAVVGTARVLPGDRTSWSLLLVGFATVLACTLTGLAFTWALPAVVAVPLVTVAWFCWIAYVPSTGSALLHNLSSTFPACCGSTTQPATVALVATSALTGTICLGVALLLVPRQWARLPRRVVAAGVVAVLAAGFGAGVAVTRTSSAPVTLQAVESRSTPLQCRDEQGLRVCLWPEALERSGELARIVRGVNPVLSGWGLDPITALTQAARDLRSVSVEAGDQLDHDDLRYTVAAGYVDQQAGCTGALGEARDERVALVALAAGLPPAGLAVRFDATVVSVAVARSRDSPEALRAWFVGDPVGCGAG